MALKAKLRTKVFSRSETLTLDIDIMDEAGDLVEGNVRLNIDWSQIQARKREAQEADIPRNLSAADALKELIGEWVNQYEVATNKGSLSPQEFSSMQPGVEIPAKGLS